jgi:hypothetical protein
MILLWVDWWHPVYMELPSDSLVPLALAAQFLWLTPGHLRRLHRQGKVVLVRPGSRNLYMAVSELDRLLGRTQGDRH